MQELIYVVHIEDGIVLDDTVLEKLDETITEITGCKVIRSRIEDEGTIVENGEWEVEEDE
jgi:hypothetical protein